MGLAGTYGKQGRRTVDPSYKPDVDPSYEIGCEWFRAECHHDGAVYDYRGWLFTQMEVLASLMVKFLLNGA